MTISTQTQYTSQMDDTKALAAAKQVEKDAKTTEAAASSSASAFEITDVFERSTDTSATDKLKTYSNIAKTASVSKQSVAGSAAPAAASAPTAVTASAGTSSASDVASLLNSSSSESSEETTTTETVYNADGSVYEKTTVTDEDGNETVTMTKISDAQKVEENDVMKEEIAAAVAATTSEE